MRGRGPPGPPPPPGMRGPRGRGPPPPPGMPGARQAKPSVKMVPFHWKKLPVPKLPGSIWNDIPKTVVKHPPGWEEENLKLMAALDLAKMDVFNGTYPMHRTLSSLTLHKVWLASFDGHLSWLCAWAGGKRTAEIMDVFRLRQKERKKKEKKKEGEKVKVDLIDGKRQTNLAIALNQFKTGGRPMESKEIVEAIKSTDSNVFGKNGVDFIER
jgi:hypothetical protein